MSKHILFEALSRNHSIVLRLYLVTGIRIVIAQTRLVSFKPASVFSHVLTFPKTPESMLALMSVSKIVSSHVGLRIASWRSSAAVTGGIVKEIWSAL
jgi:hypothetical protein